MVHRQITRHRLPYGEVRIRDENRRVAPRFVPGAPAAARHAAAIGMMAQILFAHRLADRVRKVSTATGRARKCA